ncbi:MAG: flippase [Pleurocapsa sp.]
MVANTKWNSLKNRLLKEVVGSFGLRVTYMGLTFLTNIILARFLGATEFGIYTYTVAWSYLLAVFGTVGLDHLLVREVAIYKSQSAWGLLRGILRWANQISLLISVTMALVAIALAYSFGIAKDSTTFIAFVVAMLSLPFASLRNLRRGAMRGLQLVTIGLVPEMLIAPSAIVILTAGAYWLWGDRLNATWSVAIYTAITAITLFISMVFLNRHLPPLVKTIPPDYKVRQWLYSALPFMLLEGIYVINARVDTLMLGWLQNVEAAGIYVPVNRGAQLINFVLMAITSALAPVIASLYAEGKKQKLHSTVVKTARAALIPTVVLTAILMIAAPWYLLLFGSEFVSGKNALYILCIGQFLFTSTGLAGSLLNMTGNERFTAISGGLSAILNIILNYFFITRWGVEGAATATSVSVIAMNLSNIIIVRRKLGISSTAFGL